MEANERNPLLILDLSGQRDDTVAAFAIFTVLGLCPSVFVYLSYWLCGNEYVMEILVGLNVLAGLIALFFVLGAFRGSDRSIMTVDRVANTITRGFGSSARTYSIAGRTGLVLYQEQRHRRRSWGYYFVYHLVIEAETPVHVITTTSLLETRALGKKIADHLDLAFDDQTRELTNRLLPRDLRAKFGATPRSLGQKLLLITIHLSLGALTILTLVASVLVGVGVHLTRLHYRHAPLIVPLGSLTLWIVVFVLREEPADAGSEHFSDNEHRRKRDVDAFTDDWK